MKLTLISCSVSVAEKSIMQVFDNHIDLICQRKIFRELEELTASFL
jgi:hypothetical protein